MALYDSFLLRIWHSVGDGGSQWAIRLENVQHGDQAHFTSLDALLAHLRAIADPRASPRAGVRGDAPGGAEPGDGTAQR